MSLAPAIFIFSQHPLLHLVSDFFAVILIELIQTRAVTRMGLIDHGACYKVLDQEAFLGTSGGVDFK